MARLRYLLKNISLLNLVLVIALAYLLKTVVLPFFGGGASYTPPEVKKRAVAELAKGKVADAKSPSPFDYVVIGDQNLFHPERKIPVPKVEAPPLPKPDFVLYGTMETEEFSVAYMEDKKAPKTTQGRGKRVTTLRQGDSLSGFILKDVDVDKVVMLRGEETMVVHLADRGKVREGSGSAAATPGASVHPPSKTPSAFPPSAHPTVTPQSEHHPETKPATQPVRPPRRGLFGARP
ncbi:MAG: hypothetical protein C0402_13130 [Thermodesulfovibrio sp.]|nr:hypothetical protein [Thermodesulfovibrio sp.]